jgi:uncharacterized protein YlxW (UPF0749 family)
MTPERLKEIRQKAIFISQPPWELRGNELWLAEEENNVLLFSFDNVREISNLQFACDARAFVPELLDAVESLQAKVKTLESRMKWIERENEPVREELNRQKRNLIEELEKTLAYWRDGDR